MRRIFRYEVPVDDQWHALAVRTPLHVGCRTIDVVEFWAWEPGDLGPIFTEFRVFGTGQRIGEGEHVGTVVAPGGQLVWHLVRRT